MGDAYDTFFDPGADYRNQLLQSGQQAGAFATGAQQGFNQYGQQAQASLDYLRGQMMGNNSVSAEQLRQALMQNQATQRAMAASASPQDAAMAAQTAMMNSARLGYGMSGQAATAGLQERNQAAQNYGALLSQLRGQNLQGVIGGYQTAGQNYGTATANPGTSLGSVLFPTISSATAAMAMSDERAKKDIADGDEDANRLLEDLKAYSFRYKDERNGRGKQVGVMAQELERAGAKHAVVDTPRGKMIDGAKLATTNTAMLATLARRVKRLEERGRRG